MKTTKTQFHFGILLLLAVFVATAVAQQQVLTPETILTLRNVADVQLSPDGSVIAYQVSRSRTADERPGSAISEIWMVFSTGGDPIRFTYNDRSDRSPQWAPDGMRLAFLSQRGSSNITQVYLINAAGGEAVPVTKAENSVASFKWSPKGDRIAYTMTDTKSKEEQQDERDGKDWTVADQNYKHTRLYTVDVNTGETNVVTQSDLTIHDFDWSPTGDRFVLAATETPLVDDSYMKVQVMVVPSSGGVPTLLVATRGKLNSPRWSPDGKWISWLGAVQWEDSYAGSVFVVPSQGGTAENLVKGWEGTAVWLGWMPEKPATIVFGGIERQAHTLYTVSMSDKKRALLSNQPVVYGSWPSFSRNGKSMAFAANTPRHPNEVFFGEAGNRPARRLTTLNPQLANVRLGEQEIVKWKSTDGWEIEGVLVKPVGYEKGKRYPLVMQPHGGPEAADLNGWYGSYSRWGQMLAGRGYAVFYPNYRGSLGRGPSFAMADQKDLMGKEFEDMVSGIDHLISIGVADPNRVGVGGGSYGGYTSAWAATYGSARFKAAIAWMGISNWISMTGTSDIFLENSTVHWNLMMYEDNNYDIYWQRSPLAHIDKANTPTLIIHGAVDPRVPIGQSQELYTALKWKGVPTEFVTYPRAGHGVSERAHQYDFMQRVNAWFDKYLRDGMAIK
jgi:dipeptidyl aminopeptidase/acylaminoacyl peptidase